MKATHYAGPIRFAAQLVRCPDGTPQDVQELRCLAALIIKDQAVEIERLRAIVNRHSRATVMERLSRPTRQHSATRMKKA